MKPLKSQIKKDASLILQASIESIFNTLHKKYKTSSGDISPYQQYILNEAEKQIIDIISEQVFQNIDLKKVNLEKMTREDLLELAYSLDWNGSWDADEEGQKPITKNELIESITNMINQ
jgi:ABC-type branched-subunit amino acid transport system ATPase component